METDHTIVEDAETLFLSGNFRKALMLCNKILKDPLPSTNDDPGVKKIPLDTPLHLSIDASNKKIRRITLEVDFGAGNGHGKENDCCESKHPRISLVDRAAAISLQSWYEISRRLSSTSNDKKMSKTNKKSAGEGHIHLKPFLDVYAPENRSGNSPSGRPSQPTSRSARDMPLELAVVFVHFLRTLGTEHIHESVELGAEIVCRTIGSPRNSRKFLPHSLKDSCQEILGLLFLEIIPFCSSQDTVKSILNRFFDDKHVWNDATWHLGTHEEPNADSIVALISFLDKPPKLWTRHAFPSEEFTQQCRSSLSRLLKLRQNELSRSHLVTTKEAASLNEAKRPLATDLSNTSTRSVSSENVQAVEPSSSNFRHIFQPVLQLIQNKDILLRKLQENKTVIVFALTMLLIAWRRRKRLASVSAAAIRILLAPIHEVVDAIIKPSS